MCISASARRSPSTPPRRCTPRRAASPPSSATSSTARPYADVYKREQEYARCPSTTVFTSAPPTRLHQGARQVRERLRRHLVQVLHELQGRGRPLPGLGRHRRRLFLGSAQRIRARRQADHRLPHREHRDRQPHACQSAGRGRQDAEGLGRVQAGGHRIRTRDPRDVLRRAYRRARLLPAHLLAPHPGRSAQVAQALRPGLDRDLPALPHAYGGFRACRHRQGEPAVAQQGRPGRNLGTVTDGAIDLIGSDHSAP